MIKTMSRGNQENRVGLVQGRQVVQVEEEEDMKMENMEGTENIEGNESNGNVSSGEIRGNKASTQKRTTNIAQAGSIGVAKEISGEISEKVASTQKRTTASVNSAQAVSKGVAKGVVNDSKQAQTQHLAARGLIETISTRATTIYNSIYKATFIPNMMDINSNDNNNNNNNNINGVDNVIENEENNNLVNSSDNNSIIIYDASGVEHIIQIGENNNLVNNSTVCTTNINDINNNFSGLDSEENRNTPGEVNRKIK
jgi:hypothetical protein